MHDFVFSTPNTMEIRGRAKEVGISDLGLLKAEGIACYIAVSLESL